MEFSTAYEQMSQRVGAVMEPGVKDAEFGRVALELFEFQREWNSALRNFCEGKSFCDWRAIPAVPSSAFRDMDRPLTCFPVADGSGYFETSGTSGEVKGRHYFYNFDMYQRSIEMGWAQLVIGSYRLPSELPKHWLPGLGDRSSLGFMLGALSGRKASAKLDFDHPVVLMGTALSFLHLFESGCDALPEGSWAMETGGYKGSGREISKADLYAMFDEHLGVPSQRVINEYGMTELSSQFYSCGVGGYHLGSSWARAVVRSPESGEQVDVGEAGYLTIYDLANIGSVLAVATQDIAVRREGGGFELLGRDPAAIPRGCSRAADEFLSR